MSQIAALIAAAALFLGAVAANAQTLRHEVAVDGDRVLLGDIFDGAGPAGRVPVLQAPEPGREIVLEADWLARAAAAHGLAWRPASRHERAVVTRTAVLVPVDDVREALAGAAAERMAGRVARAEVEVDERDLRIGLPPTAEPTVAVESIDLDPSTGRFSATLAAPAHGPVIERRRITGRAHALIDVPVLARRVLPGEVIGIRDIDWVQVRDGRAVAEAVVEPERLIGMTVRRAQRAGEPIRFRDLVAPVLVARGGAVSIVFEGPNLTLVARGRALEDGAAGQTIRVANAQSDRVVEARVDGPGVVRIVRPELAYAAPR
jgi:flagella basal body P-ring formation protein FlgA